MVGSNLPDNIEKPFEAYEGESPYIFVSYAHKDAELVFKEIKRFHDAGYPIWYDDAVTLGEEWDTKIANALIGSSLVVVFISKNSMASHNVQDEIRLALKRKINIAPIYLEDTELPPSLELRLSSKHAIFKFKANDREYINDCFKAFKFANIGKVEFADGGVTEKIRYDVQTHAVMPTVRLTDIEEDVHEFIDNLQLYDDVNNGHCYKDYLKASIDDYIHNPNSSNAFLFYRLFFGIYQLSSNAKTKSHSDSLDCNRILELIKAINRHGDKKDIFSHSLNVFLLGLSIYSKNKNYRDIFKRYILNSKYRRYYRTENGDLSDEEFLYRWGITSLCHDMTISLEESLPRIRNRCFDDIKSILDFDGDIGKFTDLNFISKIDPDFGDKYRQSNPEAKFLDLYKPTDIMAHRISDIFDLDLKEVQKNIIELPNHMPDYFIDTAYFSSVLLLNAYGGLMQDYNRASDLFFYPIADCATAVLLNKCYGNILQRDPFNLAMLDCSKSPLTYLLIMCNGYLNVDFADLKYRIDDNNLVMIYTVQSQHSREMVMRNDETLSDVLDIKGLFHASCSINVNITDRFDIGNIALVHPNISEFKEIPMGIVEKLAIQHYIYASQQGGIAGMDYHDLEAKMKLLNIHAALQMIAEINTIGCETALLEDSHKEYPLSNQDILDLAINHHDNWCSDKFADGWSYGENMDIETRKNPFLVPWSDLDSQNREKNINYSKNITNLLNSSGLKIVKS